MLAACAMQEQPPRMGQIYGTAKKICESATIPLSAIQSPVGLVTMKIPAILLNVYHPLLLDDTVAA